MGRAGSQRENQGAQTPESLNHQSSEGHNDRSQRNHSGRGASTPGLLSRDRGVCLETQTEPIGGVEHEVRGQASGGHTQHLEFPSRYLYQDGEDSLFGPQIGLADHDRSVAENEHRSHKSEPTRQPLGQPAGGHASPTVSEPAANFQTTEGRLEISEPLLRGTGFIQHTRRGPRDVASARPPGPRRVLFPELVRR